MTQVFDYELLTGEYISVQYTFLEGESEVGQPDAVEIYVSDFQLVDITLAISELDYERIRKKCFEHWENAKLDDEFWEAGNE